jgi:CheY-like chemotaxis protein
MSQQAIELPARRSQLDIMKAQLRAVDAWNRAHNPSQRAAETASMTPSMRLELARRTDGLRREQQAVVARADEQLRASGEVTLGRVGPRVVLAHRNGWFREKVTARLAARGVRVVGAFEDGADAAGTLVAEQPDLVLVEDGLPTLTGVEVVRRARQFAPGAFVAAQVMDSDGVSAMVDAGAGAVFTRRIPPVELADELVGCLTGQRRSLVLI